ncbi:Transcription factor GTE10-like protein [Drosera capensis]
MAPTAPVVFSGQKEATVCSEKTLAQMMGNSRKVTKKHQDGFVPNYRHAVETMAESEGFGSSGRVDTKMTQSDDSNQPQRRCISLNLDPYDHFGVPVDVLSLSTMSKSEKSKLEIRLKRELDQIRSMLKKVESFPANAVVLSPVSDIRSCSDGQKRPALEISKVAPEHFSQGKKRGPPMHNGPSMKTETGHGEGPKQGSTSNGLLMKQCENLLKQLMSHKWGWIFNTPVDVVKLKIPDYFKVIKHPMDLGTIKGRISSGKYENPLDFAADVRLTFDNALTYNPAGTDAYIMAQDLSKLFEQRWKSIEKKIHTEASACSIPIPKDAQMGSEKIDYGPPPKKKKDMPTSNVRQIPAKRTVTVEDKKKLGADLENLLEELPDSIIDFLKESSSAAGQNNVDEIEIDIEALSDDTLFTLRKLLDDFLLEKKKNQMRGEPCEMELHNESGFSNSSMQPSKVNNVVDEDVDICAPDPPASSFPRLGNETDTTNKNDNSISSSGDSGSSSSDSDTSSSSGDESDGPKAAKGPKTMNAAASLGQNQVNPADKGIGRNEGENGSNQPGQSSLNKPLSVEVNGEKEGGSALSGQQVSPDKLYRAALLRNRFADTILKAQEKTLDKGEKLDPERLRLEKEELERKQREERARLQAEARAAEKARKKAEAMEAKRKRELEREAARLALQKMEKTVEINENSGFMKDLELLSSAPPDDLSTFLDSASPNDGDNSLLGSFKLRGISNPLEQLGLYMKADDEEEEEVEAPKRAAAATDDVEEGEIDP